MAVFAKVLITIFICDVVFALLAVPLMLRRVPPNVVYGYRTRATLTNEAVWYAANAHFGRGLLIASVISALGAVVLYRTHFIAEQPFINLSVAVLVIPTLIAALATSRYIRSLR